MGAEVFTEEQIGAAEALLVLINPGADEADQQIGQLRAMVRSIGRAGGKVDDEDEGDDEEADDHEHILWLVNDVIDWESGYAVDWKDSRACIESVTALAARWGVQLQLAAPKGSAVAGLLAEADRQLAAHGLILWSWDTQSDCYCGFITRAGAASELAGLSGRLGVAIRRAGDMA